MTNDKKVALVTGANRGIGLETARQLGQSGITVVVAARSLKAAKETAATPEEAKDQPGAEAPTGGGVGSILGSIFGTNKKRGLYNGAAGTITAIEDGRVSVELDGRRGEIEAGRGRGLRRRLRLRSPVGDQSQGQG